MRLPCPNAKEVAEFKKLWKEVVGQELSDADALEYATRLIHVYVLMRAGDEPSKDE